MSETYTGVLTELGGAEIGSTGKEKPRKVIVKNGERMKTFRCWSSSDIWQQLQPLGGKPVTVSYDTEQRQGPSGPYQQNNILAVQVAAESTGGGWESGAGVWGSASSPNTQPPPVSSKDDYWAHREVMDEQRSQHMAAAWSISQAIALLSLGATEPPAKDHIETVAHQLLVLKEQIVSETSQ